MAAPIAKFLGKCLQTVARSSQVAVSSLEVTEAVQKTDCKPDCVSVASFDFENLYPSIGQQAARDALYRRLVRHFTAIPVKNWGYFVEFLCDLLMIVFRSQILVFRVSTHDKM